MDRISRKQLVTLALALLASSCGSPSGSDAARAETSIVSTVAPKNTTTSSVAASTTVAALRGTEAMLATPAIPTKEQWVFDETVWGFTPLGDTRLAMSFQAGVRVLDLTDDSQVEIVLPQEEHRRIEPWGALKAHGDRYLSVRADERHNGSIDQILAVDTISNEVTGSIAGPAFITGDDPGRVLINGFEYDLASMTKGEAVTLDNTRLALRTSLDNELWTLRTDGTIDVQDARSYEAITSFQLDAAFALFSTGGIGFSDSHLLLRLTESKLMVVDRQAQTAQIVDLGLIEERFGEGTSISGLWGTNGHSYGDSSEFMTMVRTEREGQSRWFLATIDVIDAELTALFTVADGSLKEGWNIADFPKGVRVGERLFVSDHPRRIVEVDLEQLGSADKPWVDDSLSYLPVLDADEEEVVAVLRALLGNDEDIGFSLPDRANAVREAVQSKVNGDEWEIIDLVIDDGRAWSRARPFGELGYAFTFLREGDEWVVDVESVCSQLSAEGAPC